MIVLDSSAVIEVLMDTSRGMAAIRRWTREGVAVAPHIVDVEVLHVIRRLVATKAIDSHRGARAIDTLARLPIDRRAHDHLLTRMWQLRGNLTAYDAAYVTLAEMLGAPLLTSDAKLAAAPGHRAQIEVL